MIYTIAIIISFTGATIAYSYFYIKKLQEKFRKKNHALESKVSYYKKKLELNKEILFDVKEYNKELILLCTELGDELGIEKTAKFLRKTIKK